MPGYVAQSHKPALACLWRVHTLDDDEPALDAPNERQIVLCGPILHNLLLFSMYPTC